MAVTVSALEFDHVTKRFGSRGAAGAVTAVENLSFSVAPREFVSVVGPSGCGKSTLLNMISGLDLPSEGAIRLDGAVVTGPSPRVAFMLQKDLLLPWRSIRDNIAFGLEARAVSKAERNARVARELDRCRLTGFGDHYPHQLSGGMRQRAALARTLAVEPDIILLDEPFSALDAQTKLILQRSFARTIADAGVTALFITHDLNEAVLMSDRVVVMSGRPGRIIDDITIDLPARADPMARRAEPRVQKYFEMLFGLLHLEEQAA